MGVNNGWNYTDLSTSGSKTGEFNATYTPNKMLSFALTGYFGKDDVIYDDQKLSLIDFVGTYNVTSALTLILNADIKQVSGNGLGGNDATQHINGFAGYANYGINDSMRVSFRGEYLDYIAVGHAIEGTLTFGYTPVKNFEVRARTALRPALERQDADRSVLCPRRWAMTQAKARKSLPITIRSSHCRASTSSACPNPR